MKLSKTNSTNALLRILFLIIFAGNVASSNAQGLLELNNNSTICFIGNSITQDGRYHMLLQTYYATRFPGTKVEMYNCGISGDVTDGMLARLNEDILTHKPKYAFLMTGMNDIMQYLYEPDITVDSNTLVLRENALKNYYAKTEKLATLLAENNVSTIFMTPSIYDQTAKLERGNRMGANDALKKCSEHIRKLAKKYNAPLVDLNPYMEEINLKGQAADSTFTIVGHDRVHPGDVGHFIMAAEIINTIMPSKYVSQITIDAKKKKVLQTENCEVSINKKFVGLQFDVLQKALPFPVESRFQDALGLIPFQSEINNELFSVKNLPNGNYQLQIDGKTIDTLTSETLGKGVNLTTYKSTPQYMQALDLFSLCEKYHKTNGKLRIVKLIEYKNLKNYTGPDNLEEKRKYLDAELEKQKDKPWYWYNVKMCKEYFEVLPIQEELWSELKDTRDKIYEQNKPILRKYKLIKV